MGIRCGLMNELLKDCALITSYVRKRLGRLLSSKFLISLLAHPLLHTRHTVDKLHKEGYLICVTSV